MSPGNRAPLPGATGISHLSPYTWPAADGVCGGGPHMHLVCTEAYIVTGGRGAVQTLTLEEGHRDTPLEAGSLVWFTPGTVHRMVEGEALRVTVLMENAGLPEAGDAVFTFPPGVLADPGEYARAAAVPTREEEARRRRDLAVEGYLTLRQALQRGDTRPLLDFQAAAARLVAPKAQGWEPLWQAGALAAAQRTGRQVRALAAGEAGHLRSARVSATTPNRTGGWGMCGRRDEYALDGPAS